MRSALILLVVTTGCGLATRSAPTTGMAAEVAGCFALEYGAWGSEITNGLLPSRVALPTQIQLDAAPDPFWSRRGQAGRPWYIARALSGTASDNNPFRVWKPRGVDSVFVGLPVQIEGFNLKLEREGVNLRGEVEAYTDVISATNANQLRTSVLARRIPCRARLLPCAQQGAEVDAGRCISSRGRSTHSAPHHLALALDAPRGSEACGAALIDLLG